MHFIGLIVLVFDYFFVRSSGDSESVQKRYTEIGLISADYNAQMGVGNKVDLDEAFIQNALAERREIQASLRRIRLVTFPLFAYLLLVAFGFEVNISSIFGIQLKTNGKGVAEVFALVVSVGYVLTGIQNARNVYVNNVINTLLPAIFEKVGAQLRANVYAVNGFPFPYFPKSTGVEFGFVKKVTIAARYAIAFILVLLLVVAAIGFRFIVYKYILENPSVSLGLSQITVAICVLLDLIALGSGIYYLIPFKHRLKA